MQVLTPRSTGGTAFRAPPQAQRHCLQTDAAPTQPSRSSSCEKTHDSTSSVRMRGGRARSHALWVSCGPREAALAAQGKNALRNHECETYSVPRGQMASALRTRLEAETRCER